MLITDVITLAKFSELSGVAVKDNDDAIVAFINMGMIELYSRFPIRVEEHIVTLNDTSIYHEMPEDFLYPLEAFGEKDANGVSGDYELDINDSDSDKSIFFNDWNTAQIPMNIRGDHVSILYVVKPARITVEQATDGVTELDLPDTLVDALLSYIGYRAYLGVRSDAQSENNTHWARFERNCKRAAAQGVAFPSESPNMTGRLHDRGFV